MDIQSGDSFLLFEDPCAIVAEFLTTLSAILSNSICSVH